MWYSTGVLILMKIVNPRYKLTHYLHGKNAPFIYTLRRRVMRSLALIMLLILGTVTSVTAGDYNYIAAPDMKSRIETGSNVIIVDIQV
jgi:hypothetical protein